MHHIKKIETAHAPKAIGPYSQAVKSGPFIFVSGQLPIDPKTGNLLVDDIKVLTEQVIDNIEQILKEAHASLSDVVRVDIFLTDLTNFSDVNEVYQKRFSKEPYPARQTIEVKGLPKGALIEMSCIAICENTPS